RQSEQQAASGSSDRYDTHPSLREREAALAGVPETSVLPKDGAEAITLLDGVPELELALLQVVSDPAPVAKLRPIGWGAAAPEHWLPYWRRVAAENAAGLAGVRVRDLAELAPNRAELQKRFPGKPAGFAAAVVVSAFIAALVDAGFALSVELGDDVVLRR